jgi:tetratricopeptide (TPR) repeat protein
VARKRRNKNAEANTADGVPQVADAAAEQTAALRHDAKLARFRFWTGIVIFQVIFGGCVFVLTKAHYQHPQPQSTALVSTPRVQTPAPPIPISSFPSNDPVALKSRANDQFLARDFLGAVETYERLVKIEPNDPDTLNNLGLVLHYVKRSDAAIASLERAVGLSPNHQRSWLTIGFVRKSLGQNDAARAAFEKVLAIDPNASITSEARRMMAELGNS